MYKVHLVDGLPNINLQDISLEKKLLADIAEVTSENVKDESELSDTFYEADVIIPWHLLTLSAATIKKLKQCKGIIRTGVGYDSVDVKTAGEQDIPVFNIPDYGTQEVADHALALILNLSRRVNIYLDSVKGGVWDWQAAKPVTRLSNMTLGIIGYGRIGQEVAKRAKAFGFNIIFYDPYLSDDFKSKSGSTRVKTLSELLSMSDIVSLHVPLTDETKYLISEKELNLMKPDSILVNTSRGPVVESKALVKALKQDKLAGVGLDVIENEPQVPDELKNDERVLITPHAAFYSEQSMHDLRRKSAEITRAILLGEDLPEPVNAEFLK